MGLRETPARTGRPSTTRAADIAASISRTTLEMFAEDGIDFSMDRLAERAGVSKQAIYRRWPSKDELLNDVIASVFEGVLASSVEESEDSVLRLRQTAWTLFDRDIVTSRRISVFIQAEALRNERIHGRLIVIRERLVTLYAEHLRAIEAHGKRKAGDLLVQAELLMDLLFGASTKLAIANAVSEKDKRQAFDQRWHAFSQIAILA